MTTNELRDVFASSALTGMLSHPDVDPRAGMEQRVARAYEYANLMLAEREKHLTQEVKPKGFAEIL